MHMPLFACPLIFRIDQLLSPLQATWVESCGADTRGRAGGDVTASDGNMQETET